MAKGGEQFDQHVGARPASPPAVLYKYTTVETARAVLTTGSLRFQSPLRYNDPFDSQWDVFWPTRTPEAIASERALVEQALHDPEVWPEDANPRFRKAMEHERARLRATPPPERDLALARFLDAAVAPDLPEELEQRRLDMLRRLRVLCLAENDRSLLMWSHYAEQHQGVVLGFDVGVLERAWRRPLEPVKYSDGPPGLINAEAWRRSMVFGSPHPPLGGAEREWALTKHTDWRYEREWRFVCVAASGTHGMHEDVRFPPSALAEIVTGCRIDAAVATELVNQARASHEGVRYAQMSRHASRFALVKTSSPMPE